MIETTLRILTIKKKYLKGPSWTKDSLDPAGLLDLVDMGNLGPLQNFRFRFGS